MTPHLMSEPSLSHDSIARPRRSDPGRRCHTALVLSLSASLAWTMLGVSRQVDSELPSVTHCDPSISGDLAHVIMSVIIDPEWLDDGHEIMAL